MQQAIALKVETDQGTLLVPTRPEFKRCLHEVSVRNNIPILDGFVSQDTELPSLETLVKVLNGEHTLESLDFQCQEEEAADETEEETIITPPELSHLTDEQRAQRLRQMIRERLVENKHPLPGCRDHEVSLGKVYQHWNTGLSRGSLSRHIKKVVEELEEIGYGIYSSGGRHHVEHAPEPSG